MDSLRIVRIGGQVCRLRTRPLVRRGEYQGAYEEMNKCMLCGKCRLVCPRGINTRGVVMLIKRKLGDF